MRQMQAELSFDDSSYKSLDWALREVFKSADLSYHAPLPEPKRGRIKVVCLECNRKFSSSSFIPSCPGCGGSDIELA